MLGDAGEGPCAGHPVRQRDTTVRPNDPIDAQLDCASAWRTARGGRRRSVLGAPYLPASLRPAGCACVSSDDGGGVGHISLFIGLIFVETGSVGFCFHLIETGSMALTNNVSFLFP